MIFDDTSILDDLSNDQENMDGSLVMESSVKNRRNDKLREDFFNKYAFMYSGGRDHSASIGGSIEGTPQSGLGSVSRCPNNGNW